jgi:hypothetical protein
LKTFNGITDPVPGELYLYCWPQRGSQVSSDWYAVLVLPVGSFEELGMPGSISETHLIKSIPSCYKFDRKTRTIIGWADDHRDGGPQVTRRKFPAMYFDDDQTIPWEEDLTVPPKESLYWVSASRLRPFGAYGPDGSPARGYDTATSFRDRLRAVKNAVSLRRDVAGRSADQTTGALPREADSEFRADTDGSRSTSG